MKLNLEQLAADSVDQSVRECKANMYNPTREDVMDVARDNIWRNVIRLRKRLGLSTHADFVAIDAQTATNLAFKHVPSCVSGEGR